MYIILKTVLLPPQQLAKLSFGEKQTAMWRAGKQEAYDEVLCWNLTAAIQWYTIYYLIYIKPRFEMELLEYQKELMHLHKKSSEQKKEKLF